MENNENKVSFNKVATITLYATITVFVISFIIGAIGYMITELAR